MNVKTVVTPSEGPFSAGGAQVFDRFGYSAAVRANDTLYVSGQIGLNPDGSMPDHDTAQFVNAFERLGAILNAGGAHFTDIVDLVTYHVGIQDHFSDFVAVKARFIPDPFPAWTAIGVEALARPGLIIEIKAVALMP